MRLAAALLVLAACGSKPPATDDTTPDQPPAAIDCEATPGIGQALLVSEEQQYGARNAKTFRQLAERTSATEVCMLDGQLDLLTRLTCDDGSNPFSSRDEAHRSRKGPREALGRCEAIVDVYQVPCPEKTYEIELDLYKCTASQLPADAVALTQVVTAGLTVPLPEGWWLDELEHEDLIASATDGNRMLFLLAPSVAPTWKGVSALLGLEADGDPTIIGDTVTVQNLSKPAGGAVSIAAAPRGGTVGAVVLLTRKDDPLAALLATRLEAIGAHTEKNYHVFSTMQALIGDELSTVTDNDLAVETKEVGDVVLMLPQDWKHMALRGTAMRSDLTENGESFTMIQSFAPAGDEPLPTACRTIASRVAHTGTRATWLINETNENGVHSAVIDRDDGRVLVMCARWPSRHLEYQMLLIGDPGALRRRHITALAATIALGTDEAIREGR